MPPIPIETAAVMPICPDPGDATFADWLELIVIGAPLRDLGWMTAAYQAIETGAIRLTCTLAQA
jgi:hypothetical protein